VTSGPNDSWMVRRRSLVVASVLVAAVIAAGLLAGRSGSNKGGPAPPRVSFGAHIQAPAGSNGGLAFNNGWIASGATKSDDSNAVAVYAASQPSNRQNGLLLIQRETGNGLRPWRTRAITLRGSGALTLLRPADFNTIQAAGQATLHFVTASGGTGTLDLSTDKVTVSH
jgi:hypothetical protein